MADTPAPEGPAPHGTWSPRVEPVDRRLRVRQLILLGLGLVVLVLALVDLVDGVVGPVGALAGLLGGAVVGLVALRTNRIGWHAGTGRVVTRVDRLGLAILVVLLVARLSRDWLLEHWITGALLTALGSGSRPAPSSCGCSAPGARSSPRCGRAAPGRASRPHECPPPSRGGKADDHPADDRVR